MKIDPAVFKIFAENVRADIIQRPAGLALDSAIVQKISARVKVFKDMNTDCLLSTLAMGEHQPHKAGDVVFNEGISAVRFTSLCRAKWWWRKTKMARW